MSIKGDLERSPKHPLHLNSFHVWLLELLLFTELNFLPQDVISGFLGSLFFPGDTIWNVSLEKEKWLYSSLSKGIKRRDREQEAGSEGDGEMKSTFG